MKGDEKLLHICVLLLAGIAVLASLGFACVLVAFLRQKRNDMPWEQTRPLAHKLSSSSKSRLQPHRRLTRCRRSMARLQSSSHMPSDPVRSMTLVGAQYKLMVKYYGGLMQTKCTKNCCHFQTCTSGTTCS
ncbi:unnamed protein product [Cylicostephanus goldi]|uniref:Uncharacterized protein n=1 Tax=Cylicostephanus goldi TaxID=71465 RepID=A0A3P7MZC3_CYLGO|nr:unnamed protein product [Cylicostephanus goldi]